MRTLLYLVVTGSLLGAGIMLHPLFYLVTLMYIVLVVKYEEHIKTSTSLMSLGMKHNALPAWWYFLLVSFWSMLIIVSFLVDLIMGIGAIIITVAFSIWEGVKYGVD